MGAQPLDVFWMKNSKSYEMARKLSQIEGLSVSIALDHLSHQKLQITGRYKYVIALLPDGARNY